MLLPTALAFALLSSEPLPSAAQRGRAVRETPPSLSWTFLELHGQRRSPDATREDLDGAGLRGSYEIGDGLFVRAGFDWVEDDSSLQRYEVGFGQAVPLHPEVHLFAAGSFLHVEVDDVGPGLGGGEDGWRFEGGVRGLTDKRFEAEARIGWQDLVDDGFVWGLDVRWWPLEHLGLGFGYEDENDVDVWTVGVRYGF
jgi:hypothetical protein